MTKRLATVDKAWTDPKLLDLGDASLLTWRSCMKAAHAEAMSPAELEAFAAVSGGRRPPTRKVRRFVASVSRRGGKSRQAAAHLVYSATMVDYSSKLAPGETPVFACVSPTREQARIILNYCVGYLKASPLLRGMLAGEPTADEIRLTNGAVIRCLTSDYRTLRGASLGEAVMDEASFLPHEDSATPDVEAARALEPALATLGGMLCIFSSPFKKSGLLFNLHRDFYGKDSDDTLVVSGASTLFNPTLDLEMIEAARLSDPAASLSEWFGEFRADISDYLDEALIDRATDHGGALELPPRPNTAHVGFVDASGGVGGDSYTLAVAHKVWGKKPVIGSDGRGYMVREDDHFVLDLVRGTPRGKVFDPMKITREYARICKEYGVKRVTGDAYGKEWVAQAWRECGIEYVTSERTKVEIYLEALPLFTRGQVTLRPHDLLLRELRLLERKTTKTGRDFVGHPPRGRDDYCNAALGALVLLMLDGAQSFVVTREMVENIAIDGALRRMRPSPQAVFGERRWGQMQRA
jgi:hypothetical protein